jgi:hypothetical protein
MASIANAGARRNGPGKLTAGDLYNAVPPFPCLVRPSSCHAARDVPSCHKSSFSSLRSAGRQLRDNALEDSRQLWFVPL